MSRALQINYDTRETFALMKTLRGVQADLRKQTNAELRRAAKRTASGLVSALQAHAGGTPQAGLVASTARVKSDRLPAVEIGGTKRVGHRGTVVAKIFWGSERGGRNFAAPRNPAGYWIDPTTKSFADGPAVDEYRAAVADILRSNGLL